MGFEPIEHECVVAYVQLLFQTNDTKASAYVVAQTDGNRRKAFKVVVGVGCTYGVMVDFD